MLRRRFKVQAQSAVPVLVLFLQHNNACCSRTISASDQLQLCDFEK